MSYLPHNFSLFCSNFAVKMNYFAVILAGGSGTRMGLDRPKQFLQLGEKTVLEHSVDAFHDNALIAGILIVSNPGFVHEVEAIVASRQKAGGWDKVLSVIAGGKERSDSSVNALRFDWKDADETALLFHDAVRPLVDQRIITDVCETLIHYPAVNVTLPVVDTIVRAADGVMSATVDRSTLQRVQTPQGFRLPVIREAYRRALSDPAFLATDDCGVVLRYLPDTPIALVRGSERNLKLTYRDDIPLFEFLAGERTSR